MSGKVKPKKPTGTRYKRPKYRNISASRKLPKSNTTNITPAVNFQFPGLKSERLPTPEEEENIRVDIEDDIPINNNRGPQAAAKPKWYVDDNIIPPRAAAAAASCYDYNRGPPRAAAAAARFDSDEYEKSIRKELVDRGAIPSMANDMMERIFTPYDIPNYPVTTRRVEMPSLMQVSLDIKDIEAKIRKTRAICESNEGTHLPVCVASALSVLDLMLPQQLIDEIEYQREYEAGIPDELLIDYLYRKNIITSKTILDFEDEADLITKIQLLLKKGNSTIITVYGGNNRMSHVVLIVNAGRYTDKNGRDRSGVYCVDILADDIIELDVVKKNDSDYTPFIEYLSKYDRNTNSIFVYNGFTINEKRGIKRKEEEEIHIRKKSTTPLKKRRLEGGRRTRKPLHL
jgi:hypothetical protein